MPYIKQTERDKYNAILGLLRGNQELINSPGDLNYLITNVLKIYLEKHKVGYTSLNDIIGVLECSKAELYRRIIAPYENSKIESNGDVFK